MNKRGQEVNITTIIVVILAILVLVIVAAAFTGGMKSSIDKVKELFGVYSSDSSEAGRQICDTWCSADRYKAWCTTKITIQGAEKSCSELGSSCTIPPEAGISC